MICVQQWRAVIGSWYNVTHEYFLNTFTHMKSPIFKYKIRNYFFISVLCISLLLLLLCGDIHPNPGPYRPETPSLSTCHINARSLAKPGRIDDIYEELCILHEFDIIGVSESHLDSSIPNYQVDLPNYNLCRLDRNRADGGVALYVRNTLLLSIVKIYHNLILRCYGANSHLKTIRF